MSFPTRTNRCDNCMEETESVVCDECQEHAWQGGERAGMQTERNKITAWLRDVAGTNQAKRFAECIERGDHLATEHKSEVDR